MKLICTLIPLGNKFQCTKCDRIFEADLATAKCFYERRPGVDKRCITCAEVKSPDLFSKGQNMCKRCRSLAKVQKCDHRNNTVQQALEFALEHNLDLKAPEKTIIKSYIAQMQAVRAANKSRKTAVHLS